MKCIINKITKEVTRVDNTKADTLVSNNTHEYTNKANWKKKGRKYG